MVILNLIKMLCAFKIEILFKDNKLYQYIQTMDQMIKTDKIDFKTLVAKDTQLSLNFQKKITKRLS